MATSAQQEKKSLNPYTGKVNVFAYVLFSHSVTGLCFAAEGEAPPIFLPCCCIDVGILSRRQRFYILFATAAMVWWVNFETQLGLHNGFWAFCTTLFIVMPAMCWLKGALPKYSPDLNQKYNPLRTALLLEELLLVMFIGGACFRVYFLDGVAFSQIESVSVSWLKSWGSLLLSEFVMLFYKYFWCRACCCCCIPNKFKKFDEEEGVGRVKQLDSPMTKSAAPYSQM
jgi:hypothetical protein